jgi:RHS repeat-associated protein
MVACAETLTAEDKVKGPFAHIGLRAGDSNIPNGTTDSCWFGWQTMEERNPYGGSGSTDTPTKEYIWGTYIDECIQIHLLVPAGPQQLPLRHYYLLQDTLHRAVALTNSGGEIQEAYDTDAYGNTIIFTGPGADNTWFTDDDTQSSYGANDIIYCGYRYDAETENYYVRNRYYSPILGRWLTRDPIGYRGGINLYGYVNSSPVGNVDPAGEATALQRYLFWDSAVAQLNQDKNNNNHYAVGTSARALLRGVIFAAELERDKALNAYYSHHHQSPWAALAKAIAAKERDLNQKAQKEAEKGMCDDDGGPLDLLDKLEKAGDLLSAIRGMGAGAGSMRQLNQLANALGALGKFLPSDSGVAPMIDFYAAAMHAAIGAVQTVDQSAGRINLQLWNLGANAIYQSNQNTSIPFSPAWALHQMQTADNGAGLYLGPNQQAFINAMHSPGQIYILSGVNG